MLERAKNAGCTLQDEGIIRTPWGDQSFTVRDPFGNWLDFTDVESMQRALSERSVAGPQNHLKIGKKLALKGLGRKDDEQVFASIAKVYQDTLWVKLLETHHPEAPFKEGDAVRIQYWDVDSAFYADTTVSEISSLENAYLAIAVPEEVDELQRRSSPRVRTQVPFTLSVIEGPKNSLAHSQSIPYHTFDVSIGGIRFETNLPLEKGNQIRLVLSPPDLEEIRVDLDVVTTEPVDRGGEAVHSVGATFVALELEDQIKILQFLIDSTDNPPATPEGQQGSDVEAIAASSQEIGAGQPPAQSDEAPSSPALKMSEETEPETGTMEPSDEVDVQQDASAAAADVQEDLSNEVADLHPEVPFQVVASS